MVENYDEALSFIHGRTKFKKSEKSDHLNRCVNLWRCWGIPKNLSAIHVAGTNGKLDGRYLAPLDVARLQWDLYVTVFSSFNERISVDGKPISMMIWWT